MEAYILGAYLNALVFALGNLSTAYAQTIPQTVETQEQRIEHAVRQEFGDAPVMVEVARCESGFRQFDDNGEVLRGIKVQADRGIFQVNEKYHLAASRALGLNIYSIDGNIAYARYLYTKNGTRDWNASKQCWTGV